MTAIDTAVILAAGRGSRLKELSLEHPKPMTEVNEQGILNNLIRHLIDSGLQKIVVVTGYFAEKLQRDILKHFDNEADFIFVENKIFDKTNNIYSLWLAADYIKNGFYLFEADVFCEFSAVNKMINHPAENIILLGKHSSMMSGTVVDLNESKLVQNMYLNRHQGEGFSFAGKYKTINFYKLSAAFVHSFFLKSLKKHIESEDVNSYYELIIKEALDLNYEFFGLDVEDSKWWEIDTIEDLETAESIFKKD